MFGDFVLSSSLRSFAIFRCLFASIFRFSSSVAASSQPSHKPLISLQLSFSLINRGRRFPVSTILSAVLSTSSLIRFVLVLALSR
jgi:hypothetical protein